MRIETYYDARCPKSCQALAVLCETGIEPEITKYLDTPLTKDELRSLIEAADLDVIDAVHTEKAKFEELGLSKESNDEELLDTTVSHLRLIECPFVVTDKGACMARPTEAVEGILQPVLTDPFGSPVLTTKPKLNFLSNCCPAY